MSGDYTDSAMSTEGERQMRRRAEAAERVVAELALLIVRHTSATGEHPVHVAELRNVLEPGSAPIYPEEPGYGATCSICAPDGDGHSTRFPRRRS